MKIMGLELGIGKPKGDKAATKANKLDAKRQLREALNLAARYQVTIIAVAVVGLLALTALRMMHYADPATDDSKVQDNLSKFKQVHIDQKLVQRINQLNDSHTSASPSLGSNRSNPFSE
jgi:hypothetical protein